MERMEQLEIIEPINLLSYVKESGVAELTKDLTDAKKQMETVHADLSYCVDMLQDAIVEAGKEADFVTQNKFIDFQETLGTFERKARRSLGIKKAPTGGVIFEDGPDGDDD